MSESKELKFPVTLTKDACVTCGIMFGVPDYYEKRRMQDHTDYYCPNGHKQYYGGVNDRDVAIKYKSALEKISKLQVAALFNKDTLVSAIETAKKALE